MEDLRTYQFVNDIDKPLASCTGSDQELVRIVENIWACAQRKILKQETRRFVPIFHSRSPLKHAGKLAALAGLGMLGSAWLLSVAVPSFPPLPLGQWILLWTFWFIALAVFWPIGASLAGWFRRRPTALSITMVALLGAASALRGEPQMYFGAQPPSIHAGQKTTLVWRIPSVYSAFIDGMGWVPAQGTFVIAPLQSARYRLTLYDSNRRPLQQLFADVTVITAPLPQQQIQSPPIGGGTRPAKTVVTGELLGNNSGPPGYGLYSYVLMRRSVSAELASAVITAVSDQFQSATSAAALGVPPDELNLLLIPVRQAGQANSLYSRYDVNRAEILLGCLGQDGVGPYLITVDSLVPVICKPTIDNSQPYKVPRVFLVHDLSGTTPAMASALVQFFGTTALRKSQGLGPRRLEEFAVTCRTWLARFDVLPGAPRPLATFIQSQR
jgi:hypothetical protein